MGVEIDPDVELLADMPIDGPEQDLFDRARLAQRICELAIAAPVTAPRMVALTGEPGIGKSSILRIVTARLGAQAGIALIALDAGAHASAAAVIAAMVDELIKLLAAAGVVDSTEKVRNTLSSYGNVVSSIVRLAGVKVDVGGALQRSPAAMRAEIALDLEQVSKRIVIILDHVDRLPGSEVSGLLAALHMYAVIPYLSIVIGLDRRCADSLAFERVVQVELTVPPAAPMLLARVIAGGLERLATRTKRGLDDALPLFDPDGGVGLGMITTPRDAKRAINALSAAVPLLPETADLEDACLDILLRVLVPELDPVRVDRRHGTGDRSALLAELSATIASHRRAPAIRAALQRLLAE